MEKQEMSKAKAERITSHLLVNAAELLYGSVSVTVKIHNGKVSTVYYATTEQSKDDEN